MGIVIADLVNVRGEHCKAIEYAEEIERARQRLIRFALTEESEKMLRKIFNPLANPLVGDSRCLYLYAAYGKGKSYLLLVLRSLFEGWGRDILLEKIQNSGLKAHIEAVLKNNYLVVPLKKLELGLGRFEDVLRMDIVSSIEHAKKWDPHLQDVLPEPDALIRLQEELARWVDAGDPRVVKINEALIQLYPDEQPTLEDIYYSLDGVDASRYHEMVNKAASKAGYPLALNLGSRTAPQEFLSYYLAEIRKRGYEGMVILCDELGQALDNPQRDAGDVAVLASLVRWVGEEAKVPTIFVAVGQGKLLDHGKHLQKETNPIASLAGRFEQEPFLGDDMNDAIAGALEVNWEKLYQYIPESRPFWREREGLLKQFREEMKFEDAYLRDYAREAVETYPMHPLLVAYLPSLTDMRLTQKQRTLFTWLDSEEKKGFKGIINEMPVENNELNIPNQVLLGDYYDFVEPDLEEESTALADACRSALEGIDDSLTRTTIKTIALLQLKAKVKFPPTTENLATALGINEEKVQDILKPLEQSGVLYKEDNTYFFPNFGQVTRPMLEAAQQQALRDHWLERGDQLIPVGGEVIINQGIRSYDERHGEWRIQSGEMGPGPLHLKTEIIPTAYINRWKYERKATGRFVSVSELMRLRNHVREMEPLLNPVYEVIYCIYTDSEEITEEVENRLEEAAKELKDHGYIVALPKTRLALSKPYRDWHVIQVISKENPGWQASPFFRNQQKLKLRGLLTALRSELCESRFDWYAPERDRSEGVSTGRLEEFVSEVLEERFDAFPGPLSVASTPNKRATTQAIAALRQRKWDSTGMPSALKALQNILEQWGLVKVQDIPDSTQKDIHLCDSVSLSPKTKRLIKYLEEQLPTGGIPLEGDRACNVIQTLTCRFGLDPMHIALLLAWFGEQVKHVEVREVNGEEDFKWDPLIHWLDKPQNFRIYAPKPPQIDPQTQKALFDNLGATLAREISPNGAHTCESYEDLAKICRQYYQEYLQPTLLLVEQSTEHECQLVANREVYQLLKSLEDAQPTAEFFERVLPERVGVDKRNLFSLIIHELSEAVTAVSTTRTKAKETGKLLRRLDVWEEQNALPPDLVAKAQQFRANLSDTGLLNDLFMEVEEFQKDVMTITPRAPGDNGPDIYLPEANIQDLCNRLTALGRCTLSQVDQEYKTWRTEVEGVNFGESQ